MLELLTRQIATLVCPPLLCVFGGQRRTCQVGGIIFSVDKEKLISPCYFLECVYYSYILFI